MSVKKLIDQTFSYSQTNADLKDLYTSDMNDFIAVNALLGVKHFESASKLVDEMDTEPREAVCLAIAEEYGSEFLAKNFRYEVAQ